MDIPDDVVEAAAEALKPIVPNSDGVLWEFEDTDPNTGEPVQPRPVTLHDAARAALAAASGPWAEQLDAANARTRALEHEVDERDKAHEAIVAMLGKEAKADIKSARAKVELLAQRLDERTLQRDKHRNREKTLRAELDNLRERVNALADKWAALDMGIGLYPEDSAHRDAHEDRAEACADELRAALVRGSDDEGKP